MPKAMDVHIDIRHGGIVELKCLKSAQKINHAGFNDVFLKRLVYIGCNTSCNSLYQYLVGTNSITDKKLIRSAIKIITLTAIKVEEMRNSPNYKIQDNLAKKVIKAKIVPGIRIEAKDIAQEEFTSPESVRLAASLMSHKGKIRKKKQK